MNYGAQIKSQRISQGWTQSELADRCGVTLRTIQRLEKGEVRPSLFTQTRLQDVLGVGFEEEEKDPEFMVNDSVQQNFFKRMQTAIPFLTSNRRVWAGLLLLGLGSFFWKSQFQNSFLENEFYKSISKGFEIQTVNCGSETECDIQVTRKNENGEILWQKTFGGSSYDKATMVLATADQGVLILGSTSSFGQGNYDILLIKVNQNGEFLWQETFGGFFNEYAKNISYLESDAQYRIEGSQQTCTTTNVSEDCEMTRWSFLIDMSGKEVGKIAG